MRKGQFGRVRISHTGRLHAHPQTHEQGSKDGIGNGAGGVGVGDGGGGGRGDGLRMREPMHHSSEGQHEREGHAHSARWDAREREFDGRAHTISDEDAEEEEPEGKTPRGIEPLQPRTLSEAGTTSQGLINAGLPPAESEGGAVTVATAYEAASTGRVRGTPSMDCLPSP